MPELPLGIVREENVNVRDGKNLNKIIRKSTQTQDPHRIRDKQRALILLAPLRHLALIMRVFSQTSLLALTFPISTLVLESTFISRPLVITAA